MYQQSLCPVMDMFLEMVDDTEAPTLFYRWALIAGVGALLHRKRFQKISVADFYPNQYIILLGPPASRKNAAINLVRKLLQEAGYDKLAGGRTSPEQFQMDLYHGHNKFDITANAIGGIADLGMDLASFNPNQQKKVSDVFICAPELISFLGRSNHSFLELLLDLWDNLDYHDVRLKNTQEKPRIIKPTISILGGTTQDAFREIFNTGSIENGFLSRIIPVYGSGQRKRIFDPTPFDTNVIDEIVKELRRIHLDETYVELKFNKEAYAFTKELYENNTEGVADPRFSYYNGRRDAHFRSVVMIIATLNGHNEITLSDCLYANSVLAYTEKLMPTALGEFGLDSTGMLTETVYTLIRKHSPQGLRIAQILEKTAAIVKDITELQGVIVKLKQTGRIDKILKHDAKEYYVDIARTIENKSKYSDFKLLKEYRDNPAFYNDIPTVGDSKLQQAEMEAEITRELAANGLEYKGGKIKEKKAVGRPKQDPDDTFAQLIKAKTKEDNTNVKTKLSNLSIL